MQTQKGAHLEVPEKNLVEILFERAAEHGHRPAFLRPRPGQPGAFDALTWREVTGNAREIGNGLLSLGVEAGDRVAILADTRAEWALADYGILAAGAVTVTIFPTLLPEQVRHLLADSGARVVFIENAEQYEKVRAIAGEVPSVEHWVTFDAVERGADEVGKRTLHLSELVAAGRGHAEADPRALDERVEATGPDDLATLIYTSGTTGVPKGAMITHRNIVASTRASIQILGLKKHPRALAFLPLAHSYQRQTGFLLTELAGSVAFSTPRTLVADLKAVKPTLVASVPRLYERMYAQIQAGVREQPERRQRIFHKAEAVAMEYGRAIRDGGVPSTALKLKHALFDRLVYGKLREALGFDRLEMAVTGAAAIRPDLLCFFQGIGVNILEGYGLTETIAPSNVNPPGRFRPGTVGPTYPGMVQAIAEDGEILMQGPNVFTGYWNQPEETERAFVTLEGERWFLTGDVGAFDEAGYLRIVDRKKEIEVLDTGKNVAPLAVEERLKASPLVTEALLVANGRKFCGALLQPDFDALVRWAEEAGVPFDRDRVVVKDDPTGQPMTYAVGRDLLDHPDVLAQFQQEVDRANGHLADYERVKAFRLADHAFTMDRDELTPTLKKKRRVIQRNHEALIEDMFRA